MIAARASDAAAPSPVAPAQAAPARGRFTALVDRPLFTPGRRAPTAAPSDAREMAAVDAPSLTLVGVMVGDDQRLALAVTADGDALRLRVGDAVEGWTVARIEPRALSIEANGVSREFFLGDAPTPRAGAPRRSPTSSGRSAPSNGLADIDSDE